MSDMKQLLKDNPEIIDNMNQFFAKIMDDYREAMEEKDNLIKKYGKANFSRIAKENQGTKEEIDEVKFRIQHLVHIGHEIGAIKGFIDSVFKNSIAYTKENELSIKE